MKEYIQDRSTLVLHIKYNQYKELDIVQIAFNILLDKRGQKTTYIIKAIDHCNNHSHDCKEERDFLFPLRCAKFLKSYYNLDSKETIKTLLDEGFESEAYIIAEKRALKSETPRASLLSFSPNDKHQVEMHNKLFQMDPVDRINLICASVTRYALDGMDSSALMAMSYGFMRDIFTEYKDSEDKESIVNKFYHLITMSESFEDIYE